MTSLADRSCRACATAPRPLDSTRAAALLAEIPGWTIVDGQRLRRAWRFPDFASALAFVNRVGAIAEAENHHPDLRLAWGMVEAELFTHLVGGLSESDFVLAAKIDRADETGPAR